jgi:virginiamycin B lyase
MRKKPHPHVIPMLLLMVTALSIAPNASATPAGKTAKAALMGRVSSEAEGPMEGVLVRAKGEGKTISVTVVSDRAGGYSFPLARLAPGKYSVDIRAVGYDLAAPVSVDLTAGNTARANLKLVKTKDLTAQLTSSEWLASVPGTEAQKNQLFRCAACHSLERIVKSTHDEQEWLTTFARMRSYSEQAVPEHPVLLPYQVTVQPDPAFAKYLATINLSATKEWKYQLKTRPRPTGRATRVIITEYDLPDPGRLPHDADLDDKGMVWYNDFREPLIGRLDPKTGETKEWRMPPLKPGFPEGTLSIEFGPGGYLWIPRFRQGGYTRFDPRTEKFETWLVPPEYNDARAIQPQVAAAPDGSAWFPGGESLLIFRVDPETGRVTTYPMYPGYKPDEKSAGIIQFSYNATPVGHSTYGVWADSKSNVYMADIVGGNLARIDPKTGEVKLFKTPTLNSGPRRLTVDEHDRVWFGEYYANKLGMFDPKAETFEEWTAPTAWLGPYPAKADKNGEAWTSGMGHDLVDRLDPKTGRFTEYMLPTVDANIRHIDMDNSTSPVTVWVAEVHRGKIAKIEPLD